MTPTGTKVMAKLTELDRRTLIALCEGRTNAEIAARSGCSEQIIKNRTRAVLGKANCKHRLELAVFAFHHGMVACPCGKEAK
jgi:DNA-binding NarL/FixJ family response regulator